MTVEVDLLLKLIGGLTVTELGLLGVLLWRIDRRIYRLELKAGIESGGG